MPDLSPAALGAALRLRLGSIDRNLVAATHAQLAHPVVRRLYFDSRGTRALGDEIRFSLAMVAGAESASGSRDV